MRCHRLHEISPCPLKLTWHENKSTYLSIRKQKSSLSIRLHRLFEKAPTPVLEALIQYAIKRDPAARVIIRQMAHLYFSKTHALAKPLNAAGNTYDLKQILNQMLSILPVEGVEIGWSKKRKRGKFRSITFGTFNNHLRQIRINPLLDDSKVPLYFLQFIVYHEMLHALCPTKMDGKGRCSIHTKEFREKERQFPYFQQAKAWEKESIAFFKKRDHGRS